MNKFCLLFLALTGSLWLQAQPPAAKPVTLTGFIQRLEPMPAYVFLYYSDAGRRAPDTLPVENGKYVWKGNVDAPTRLLLTARYKDNTNSGKKNNAVVFVMPGNMTITHTDSFSNTRVTGSAAHQEYAILQAQDEAYGSSEGKGFSSEEVIAFHRRKEEAIYGSYARQHPASALALYVLRMYGGGYSIDGGKIDSLYRLLPESLRLSAEGQRLYRDIAWSRVAKMKREEIPAYIQSNPASPVALNALERYCGYSIDAAKAAPLFELLPETTKVSEEGKKFAARLQAASLTAVGKPAPVFTQNDTTGKPFSLTALRGHYVLVDFWASWCAPCRAENPKVVAAYRQYKDKGFTVLGVSLEQPNARDKWLNAIHHDGLTWYHVSDFKYWQNEVAVQYGIKAVPQNLLIDPQGVIIAKNLYGKALQSKLEEIFK